MKKFKVTNYEIELNQTKFKPFQPIRVVMLSDLHNQSYGTHNGRLQAEIDNLKPDLVIAAGDLVNADRKGEEHIALALMKALAERYLVYYANGNHESELEQGTQEYGSRYERYAGALQKAGVQLLKNEYVDLQLKGLPLRIYGLEIPLRFYRRIVREKLNAVAIKELLGEAEASRFQLLIAHSPLHFEAYTQWGADLTLSGHFHGGFFRIPGLGGVISPQLQLFPRYAKGKFMKHGQLMVVGTGIGSKSMIPRLGNRPEVVVIDLY